MIDTTLDPEVSARNYAQGWWRDRTVLDDFFARVAAQPDRIATVTHHTETGSSEVHTYRELGRLVARFAGALVELGVRPGDVVSYQLPNWWQFTALHLACTQVGAVTNPILTILRRREMTFIHERVASRISIVPRTFRGFDHAGMMAEVRDAVPTLERVFAIGEGDLPDGVESFEEFFVAQPWEERVPAEELHDRRAAPDSPAQIQYTSGTTGEPKGVLHTHNTLYASMRSVPWALGLGEDDPVLMASPMGHQTGFLYGCLMPMSIGMKAVYQDVWDPAAMLGLVEKEGIAWTMGSATFVADACAASRKDGERDLSSLRVFTSAGAPIPPKVVADAREVLGTTLIAGWGMTENGLVTTLTSQDPEEKRLSTDGRAVPWMEVRIVDPDGADLPRGEVGRLLVRGASQAITYFKRPDLYAASCVDDWFDTQDLARMDDEGYIRIAGRTKDVIIRGGENIPVVEVEALLVESPFVREVAVVGVPDERLGERARAVVVPADPDRPPTLQELQEHLAARGMAKHFWPESLEVRPELPKTASGKIQKYKLREALGEA